MTSPSPTLKLLVVDDHEAVLGGTVMTLEKTYPTAAIRTATTVESAQTELSYGAPE